MLADAFAFSHSTNTLGKGKNPTKFPQVMAEWLGRLGSLTLVWQLVKEKENSECKHVEAR